MFSIIFYDDLFLSLAMHILFETEHRRHVMKHAGRLVMFFFKMCAMQWPLTLKL